MRSPGEVSLWRTRGSGNPWEVSRPCIPVSQSQHTKAWLPRPLFLDTSYIAQYDTWLFLKGIQKGLCVGESVVFGLLQLLHSPIFVFLTLLHPSGVWKVEGQPSKHVSELLSFYFWAAQDISKMRENCKQVFIKRLGLQRGRGRRTEFKIIFCHVWRSRPARLF